MPICSLTVAGSERMDWFEYIHSRKAQAVQLRPGGAASIMEAATVTCLLIFVIVFHLYHGNFYCSHLQSPLQNIVL